MQTKYDPTITFYVDIAKINFKMVLNQYFDLMYSGCTVRF